MMKVRGYAVSLVYYRIDPTNVGFYADEEGMPTGVRWGEGAIQIACTTGFCLSPTAAGAITEVRQRQSEDFQGWVEQVTQTYELISPSWLKFSLDRIVYWRKWLVWRLRRVILS